LKGEITYVACPVGVHEYKGKRKWLDAIAYSSNEVSKEKLSGPPAMRSVPYSIERGAVTTWLPTWRKPSLSLSAAVLDLHTSVRPRITDTIWIAERFRGRLMRYFENRKLPIPALVHGKDEDGRPLRRDHSQLFILPQADKLGRIDSLYVFTKRIEGFGPEVRDAITSVKGLAWMDEIRVTPVWVGSATDISFRPRTRVVVSMTPFVTVRHWRRGRGTMDEFLRKEVLRECDHHGLPQPRRVEAMELARGVNPVKFRKYRDGDPSRKGYAFRLEFDEPVSTPFSLGYSCHFGLGQFGPEI
jgi:CRISPR-associated protein Csb2